MDHQKDHPGPPRWTTQRTTHGPGVDHPVKETPDSAHMRRMSITGKTLTALASAALILTSATGCSDGQSGAGINVTPESRAAYEEARFGTSDAKIAASLELARLAAATKAEGAAAEGVKNTLLNPKQWQSQAHGKLCEYTAALMNNADRDGTAVSERTRAAAKLILDRC